MENRNLSLSNLDESDKYRFIYSVDYIRELRDIYKEGTEHTFDEIKTQAERDCEAKKQQGGKAILLLNHCKQTLQELNDQRKCIGRILKIQAEQGNALAKQMRQEVHRRSLDESAMRQLLNELRHQNQ